MNVETIVLVSFEERRSKRVVEGGKTKLGFLTLVADIEGELVDSSDTDLYSSLWPYAITRSCTSFMTFLAASLARSTARLSLGFFQPYLDESLWKPRPSMRMTIQVSRRRLSAVSKLRTYSNLQRGIG